MTKNAVAVVVVVVERAVVDKCPSDRVAVVCLHDRFQTMDVWRLHARRQVVGRSK